MTLTELKGMRSGPVRVKIEAGPVRVFAQALMDPDPVYRPETPDEPIPVPPTFPFVMAYWGSHGVGGASTLPIEKLRGPGRLVLHGEQVFEFTRWPVVGDELEGRSVVTDVYERERSNGGKLEFYITETEWTDAASGDPVCKTIFTMVVNVRPPS